MADKSDGAVGKNPQGNNNTGLRSNMRKFSFIRSLSKNDCSQQHNNHSHNTSLFQNPDSNHTKSESSQSKKRLNSSNNSSSSNNDMNNLEVLKELQVSIQYLGKVDLRNPGYSDICETVNSTYSSAKPYLKGIDKSTLVFNEEGITIKHTETTRKNEYLKNASIPKTETLYKARRMLYCAVDKTHQKVFFFNYQYGTRAENVQMHVIVCRKEKEAKELAKRCALLFKKIQIDLHRQEKEQRVGHINGMQQIRTKSSQSLQSPSNSSKEGPFSTNCNSAEWVQERVGLSIA